MTPDEAASLRAPFAPDQIGKLPASKGRPALDYVGHAIVTDRLLSVDPEWTWRPMAVDESGTPLLSNGGLWIWMTVCGVTRPGWGDGPDIKQCISDAIRNAAMRFGVALSLWSKEDLHASNDVEVGPRSSQADERDVAVDDGHASSSGNARPASATSKNRRQALKARCVALTADGVSVADAREAAELPLVDSCNEAELAAFEALVTSHEAALEAPFAEAKS